MREAGLAEAERLAATGETSMTRPRMNGPRSTIFRTALRPLSRLTTFTRVPMGRVL